MKIKKLLPVLLLLALALALSLCLLAGCAVPSSAPAAEKPADGWWQQGRRRRS